MRYYVPALLIALLVAGCKVVPKPLPAPVGAIQPEPEFVNACLHFAWDYTGTVLCTLYAGRTNGVAEWSEPLANVSNAYIVPTLRSNESCSFWVVAADPTGPLTSNIVRLTPQQIATNLTTLPSYDRLVVNLSRTATFTLRSTSRLPGTWKNLMSLTGSNYAVMINQRSNELFSVFTSTGPALVQTASGKRYYQR